MSKSHVGNARRELPRERRGGGAERSMVNLAQELSVLGISVDLMLARAEGRCLEQVPDNGRLIVLG